MAGADSGNYNITLYEHGEINIGINPGEGSNITLQEILDFWHHDGTASQNLINVIVGQHSFSYDTDIIGFSYTDGGTEIPLTTTLGDLQSTDLTLYPVYPIQIVTSNILIGPRGLITSVITPETYTDYSAMRGPCDEGFHIPTSSEFSRLFNVGKSLGAWTSSGGNNLENYLKLPFAGMRSRIDANVKYQGSDGFYWSSTRYNEDRAYRLRFSSSDIYPQDNIYRSNASPIRCFKDVPISFLDTPLEGWTVLYQGSGNAGIYRNQNRGVISLSSDGQTWITIADKNLGATTVWNSGDTLNQANCGKYYQWGNSYGFDRNSVDPIATSSTQVDASNYGPGNYYSSSTFITRSSSPYRWDTTDNGNLWGGQTGAVQKHITTKGVVIYPPQEEQTGYQEVEYIESGSDGNEQFIRMMFPYDNGAIYTYEIDVSNVGSATGKLFTYMQSVSGQLLRIYREACSINQDMIPARQGSFTPDTYSIDGRYLYEGGFVNNEVDFRFDLLSDANFRLYSFKAYKDGVLFRDMIPCYDRSNGEIGMYDTINDVFYTNQGTGSFIKGPDVV